VRSALGIALASVLAVATPGCGIVEANVNAIETLGRDAATDGEKAYATAVVGGTIAVITGLAVAATLAAGHASSDDPGPPEVVVETELGWGFRREGDEATWYRCTSPLLCTYDAITEPDDAIVEARPAGRGRPVAIGGVVGEEVELVLLRVRRRR
jgi:hypothetical protein